MLCWAAQEDRKGLLVFDELEAASDRRLEKGDDISTMLKINKAAGMLTRVLAAKLKRISGTSRWRWSVEAMKSVAPGLHAYIWLETTMVVRAPMLAPVSASWTSEDVSICKMRRVYKFILTVLSKTEAQNVHIPKKKSPSIDPRTSPHSRRQQYLIRIGSGVSGMHFHFIPFIRARMG